MEQGQLTERIHMILKKISLTENWASDIIDEVYLSEEESELIDKAVI